jgi:hypothetical protein
MAFVISKHAIDRKKEAQGVWCEYHGGGRFLLSRIGNSKYNKKLDELRPKKRNPSTEEQIHAVRAALYGTVLLGWDEVQSEPGQPYTFSAENCMALLECCPDLTEWILAQANDLDRFRAEEAEALEGN